MKLNEWVLNKIYEKNSRWKGHPIWKHQYTKILIGIGCGTVKAFEQYFDKMLMGKTVSCKGIHIRLGSFNAKTQEITLWQVN